LSVLDGMEACIAQAGATAYRPISAVPAPVSRKKVEAVRAKAPASRVMCAVPSQCETHDMPLRSKREPNDSDSHLPNPGGSRRTHTCQDNVLVRPLPHQHSIDSDELMLLESIPNTQTGAFLLWWILLQRRHVLTDPFKKFVE
jgi:hypothetical protein